jgi:hypothetical protein
MQTGSDPIHIASPCTWRTSVGGTIRYRLPSVRWSGIAIASGNYGIVLQVLSPWRYSGLVNRYGVPQTGVLIVSGVFVSS